MKNYELLNFQYDFEDKEIQEKFTQIIFEEGTIKLNKNDSITRLQLYMYLKRIENDYNQRIQLANYIGNSWAQPEMQDCGERLTQQQTSQKYEIKK